MYGWWQCDSEARQRLGSNLGESVPFKQEKNHGVKAELKFLKPKKS